jgi:hypothetical protein
MGVHNLMTVQPADQLIMAFSGVGEFFAAVTAIRAQQVDIELSFGNINADEIKFMFHRITILANAGYRGSRSMILFGLSDVEKRSPVQIIYDTDSGI